MTITQNKDLSALNTFRMGVTAAAYAEYNSVDELKEILQDPDLPGPMLPIGGGSNLLFTGDFPGTVLHSCIKGLILKRDDSGIFVQVGAGENWDQFCLWAATEGLWGPENLSLIPGEVGAAAVQNIGAYGVEVKDIISGVEVLDTLDFSTGTIEVDECGYGYRESNFKGAWKGRFIVTSVTFRLSDEYTPRLDYGHVKEAMKAAYGDTPLTPLMIRDEIIRIRRTKLPDVEALGSAGSFFKNPYVSQEDYEDIADIYPEVPHFPLPDGRVKIPAAWLIEKAGLKGYVKGNAAVYAKQPLVIVNHTGKASPREILSLERKIIRTVKSRFGITLSPEVEHI